MFVINPVGHRQLAHSRSCAVDPEPLDNPGVRGRECETNKGIEVETQLAGQNNCFGSAEPGGFGELAPVIRGHVRPLRTVSTHELDQCGGNRAVLPVANISDNREDASGDEDAMGLRIKCRALEPMRCGRRDNRSRRSGDKRQALRDAVPEFDIHVTGGLGNRLRPHRGARFDAGDCDLDWKRGPQLTRKNPSAGPDIDHHASGGDLADDLCKTRNQGIGVTRPVVMILLSNSIVPLRFLRHDVP